MLVIKICHVDTFPFDIMKFLGTTCPFSDMAPTALNRCGNQLFKKSMVLLA